MVANEKDVIEHYKRFWSKFIQHWQINNTLTLNYNHQEEGKTKQIFVNVNDFIWKLLDLPPGESSEVLDSGCGIGRTTIYLAKKHPSVKFTGITIAPNEIKLAKKYAEQQKVQKNTRFIEGNYCNSKLSDNYFDGVFALESLNYAQKTTDLLCEMHRTLKPGGRFVIIGGFRKGKTLSPVMQKLYKIWLKGRGLINIEQIDNLKISLEKVGFTNIIINDIGNKIRPIYTKDFMLAFPFFCSSMIKKMIKFRTYNSVEDLDYIIGVTILESILSLANFSSYYTIVAKK